MAGTATVGGPVVDADTGETFVFFEAKLRRDGHFTLGLGRYV